ncbi:TAXI family TRAP transporter solute-binding subunit [Tardiphaga sp.]|uniref:TAXI family TRAP transporter solute-binding subunit n=1 Tax=Tardiphaga sp. TaxID=1926292 RepID=UPI0026236A30|nr:TAXI family TRAP transporter solute-binding subunit [Tardiphaga sp.]MDB5616660.1 transporter [Tardiphaga sp.]
MDKTTSATRPVRTELQSARRRAARTFALFVAASVLLLVGLAGISAYLILRPETLRIAVGPAGSDDVKFIQTVVQTFARDRDHVRLTLTATEGPTASLALLGERKADLAVARADLPMPTGTQAVAILRKNFLVLWSVPKAEDNKSKKPVNTIKALENLPGHRIAIIGKSPANPAMLKMVLSEAGIAADKVEMVQYSVSEIDAMARERKNDAYMAVGTLDSKITADAIAATAKLRGAPQFLSVDVSESIAQKHPTYESTEIPGSTFSSSPARPDDKIETISVDHLIVAPKTLAEATVTEMTRQLFVARPNLLRALPGVATLEKPDTDKDAAIPAHRGAAAYIDGTDRTFLERYSDFMWGGLLLLSGLGSTGAWLRSYLKRDERNSYLASRDRVLEMIGAARAAETPEQLAKMQSEVDDVLRETLDCFEDGAIEDAALLAFGLVLEQFHFAVSDRRDVLASVGEAS